MRNKQHAFTVIELLIVLALMAILSLIATPVMTDLIKRNRYASLRDELYSTLQYARARAILTGKTTEICASQDASHCHGSWREGWITRDYLNSQTLQQYTPAMGIHLQWTGFTDSIRFLRNGTSTTGNGRMYACDQQQIAWQIVLNRQGRARIAKANENDRFATLCH